jgi:hypothetical protein
MQLFFSFHLGRLHNLGFAKMGALQAHQFGVLARPAPKI